MVRDRPHDRFLLFLPEIVIRENPPRLIGPQAGVFLFLPPDVVQDTGHVRQGDKPADLLRCPPRIALDENDGARVHGHLGRMAHPVADAVGTRFHHGNGPPDQGVPLEQGGGCPHAPHLHFVKEGLSDLAGYPPGDFLCLPVLLSHAIPLPCPAVKTAARRDESRLSWKKGEG